MALIISSFTIYKERTLSFIFPFAIVVLVFLIIILILAKKHPWLIYLYALIQTIFVCFIFIDGFLIYDLTFSLIDSYKKYFHYGIVYFLT